MLNIKQIETFYPEYLQAFKRNLLREYLQYKILEIAFDSEFGERLSFMGGTATHIIHGNTRFSEDLDFDNLGLTKKEFEQLTNIIQKKLQLEGYKVEIKNVFKGAYRCYIRIPDILFHNGLSKHKEEKLLIEIDTEPQGYTYSPEKVIINKFDIFLRINVVPMDILLAQKIYAIFKRKRAMGRDFYDAVFLFGKTKPNLGYLKLKLKIMDMADLKTNLLDKCNKFNFKDLAKDVEHFLFNPSDSKRVLFFYDYIKNYEFELANKDED
ncbi:MAG: nucleotidyl transferase AbiEii/AbiGii toxin family protein [Desulfobacteraceae bacterium]|nr:MAG: nucleotidyl transferase AbiEii/AbiGii toxin family protein [Desulfobacteraceae bacterium]